MRVSIWIAVAVAVIVALLLLVIGQALVRPTLPLITKAIFSLETISPNADGDADVTQFSYGLSQNARVSLFFYGEDGTVFAFRQDEIRLASENYDILFSGVVDGYELPGENIRGDVERRLIPNGHYTWRLEATNPETGESAEKTGELTIYDGGSTLPEISGFSVSPSRFSPNQDGIEDRVQISAYLTKPADLSVRLIGSDGQDIYVPEREGGRDPGDIGRHEFDYDGGIDRGVEPPPDGEYEVIVTAQDAEGQRVRVTSNLVIDTGGDPQAEIAPQSSGIDVLFAAMPYEPKYYTSTDVTGEPLQVPSNNLDLQFTGITMPVGDMLVFKLTVENYGKVPIRTSGPWPGTVYQWDQVWGAMGVYEQSGSWRVGLRCSTSTVDWPYRWAIGAPDALQQVVDPENGNTYYYLPAGASSEVWGAVRMTSLVKARNPQQCWAGLIHEDVEVVNLRVGARDVELYEPTN
ncbi:MAG: hypothetical protein R3E39_04910 [Anaerolineae bacterium]